MEGRWQTVAVAPVPRMWRLPSTSSKLQSMGRSSWPHADVSAFCRVRGAGHGAGCWGGKIKGHVDEGARRRGEGIDGIKQTCGSKPAWMQSVRKWLRWASLEKSTVNSGRPLSVRNARLRRRLSVRQKSVGGVQRRELIAIKKVLANRLRWGRGQRARR